MKTQTAQTCGDLKVSFRSYLENYNDALVGSEEMFEAMCIRTAKVTPSEAIHIRKVYQKAKVVKMEWYQYSFTHGVFGEPDVMRNALKHPV